MLAVSSFHFDAPCTAGETRMSATSDPVFRPDGLPAWTLNRTVAGAGRFRLGATVLDAKPGDLVLLAPGVFNHYAPAPEPGGWVHQWSVFEAADDWHDLLAWPSPAPGLRHLRCGEEPLDALIGARFDDLIASVQGVHPRHRDIGRALVHVLLLTAASANPRATRSWRDPRLNAALAHAHAHLGQPLAVADLARIAGLSVSRFAHLFRAHMGSGPRAWLERRRIRVAADMLLMGSETVAAIARRVGFDDPAYFARVFRRHTGRAPRDWRRGPITTAGRGADAAASPRGADGRNG